MYIGYRYAASVFSEGVLVEFVFECSRTAVYAKNMRSVKEVRGARDRQTLVSAPLLWPACACDLRGGLPSDAAHFEHVDHVVHALFGGRPDALRQEDRRVD